jgi:hypothetical protein
MDAPRITDRSNEHTDSGVVLYQFGICQVFSTATTGHQKTIVWLVTVFISQEDTGRDRT